MRFAGGPMTSFVTCCSQVFDSEGGGMEFVAYNIGANRDLENPHLTQEEMRAVMARSAQLYQHWHVGRMPSRLVVHKTTRWRDEEVDGVLDAWSAAADIECLTVSSTPWRGVLLDPGHDGAPSEPHRGPVARGTFQQLSGRAGLLRVSVNALQMSVRGSR
jgi:hypothetical protein